MSEKTESAQMGPEKLAASTAVVRKPRLALAIATVFGVGYLKPAPGTWGSLAGLIIAAISHPFTWFVFLGKGLTVGFGIDPPLLSGFWGVLLLLVPSIVVWLILAVFGIRCSARVAEYAGIKDPQHVVIDEVSGVHLSLILGLAPLAAPGTLFNPANAATFALYTGMSVLNWKYLLAGFILFRIFDIWKPYPIRRLENLPGGWGIMADDWLAAVYAAIFLRLALHLQVL